MTEPEKIKDLLKKNKETLFQEFGIQKLGIFGSVAEGRANETSDIDLFNAPAHLF